MSGRGRLSICYAAPGQRLLSTAGSARNVLSVAEAMSEWAEVTVAFRSIAEVPAAAAFQMVEIDPRSAVSGPVKDDVAVRGLNPFAHAAYLKKLRGFARGARGRYDVLFEKGWRFSGYLGWQAHRAGVPSALIENDVRYRSEVLNSPAALARHLAQAVTQRIAARCSQRLPLVIAETEELEAALVALRGLDPSRIEVVELGVDHEIFRPQDQDSTRRQLHIDGQAMVLLYVGGLDVYHDLGPIIEALGREPRNPSVQLHVVGDGELRRQYEDAARRAEVRAVFHGQVPHHSVPSYMAAADLCLAPYRPERFYGGKIAFSTLKIPEYMACAKPVASVPQGHIRNLIEHGSNGFLLANDADSWARFLPTLPARERLAGMGLAAARRAAHLSWRATGSRYVELARRLAQHA